MATILYNDKNVEVRGLEREPTQQLGLILGLAQVNQIDCLEIQLLRTKDQPLAVILSGNIFLKY